MSEEERNDDILKRFEQMLQTNENYFFDLEEFLDIIDEYVTVGNYNMAQKAIDLGLQQYEDSVDILLYQAEIHSLNDRLEKAEELLSKLKSIDPYRIEIPLLEAELYSRKHLHKKAIQSLRNALQLPEVDKGEVYELMTVEFLYLEDYQSALETSLESLKFDSKSSTALYNAITCYDLLGQTTQAIHFLQQYLEKEAFSEVGWSLLAKKYIDQQAYKKALEALDYAIAIDDKFLGAYYDKAYVYTQLKDYKNALRFYKLTLRIADPTAFTFFHIANIYEQLEDYQAAVENYFLAINEDPGYYKSWIRLVHIKIKLNDLDSALDIIKQALDIINNQELFELLGDIHLLRKETLKAIPAYEMSLKLGTFKLPVILKLSDLYKETGQIEKYKQLLLEAKKHFPDSKEVQKRMLDY